MADDVLLNSGSGGDTIAADDIGPGVKYQRVKIVEGADGVNDGDISSANPLPVQISDGTDVALVSGTGAVNVDGSAVTQPVSAASLPLPTGAATAANQLADGHNVTVDNPVGTPVQVEIGDGVETALVTAAGRLEVDGSAVTHPISAASLPLPAGAATAANQLADGHAVTVDNAGAGAAVNIQDGGNIITVDGTVTADAGTGPWPVTDNAGSLTVDAPTATPVAVEIGDGTNTATVSAGGALDVSAATVTVSGTVTANAGTGSQEVDGSAAHDVAIAGNPVPIAARANANEPAVVGDADATYLWADQLGRLVTLTGHPSPEAPVVVNATASGDTEVIAAPGASVSLYINRVILNNGGASVISAFLQEDASAVNRGGGDLAADGGGMIIDYGTRGWKLTANTALDVNLSATGDVWVTVAEYYIAA